PPPPRFTLLSPLLSQITFLGQNDAVLPKNADRSRILLARDCAGGNLAHHVAVRACQCRTVKLAGLVSIQPFFGGKERTESEIRLEKDPLVSVTLTDWLWKAFLPVGSTWDHEVANLSGPNAVDISGMEYPATVVFVGGADPLQDWQMRYYNWLRKSGIEAKLIEYPNMFHGFYALTTGLGWTEESSTKQSKASLVCCAALFMYLLVHPWCSVQIGFCRV
ncbi:probable carboxylesterase 18, partial [Rosa rugosa]|uniref:probable carboxylesterase 18 n=1 Tax=Rosa rugosa TaxID=74645 RepID=UPI002B416C31